MARSGTAGRRSRGKAPEVLSSRPNHAGRGLKNRRVGAVTLAMGLAALWGCEGPSSPPPTEGGAGGAPGTGVATRDPAEPLFVERSREVGIDFVHFNGMSGEFYIAE